MHAAEYLDCYITGLTSGLGKGDSSLTTLCKKDAVSLGPRGVCKSNIESTGVLTAPVKRLFSLPFRPV